MGIMGLLLKKGVNAGFISSTLDTAPTQQQFSNIYNMDRQGAS